MVSIAQWLEGLGLGRYATAFTANDIDLGILRDLTEQDLEKLGVSLGHRKKLLRAIAALPQPATEAPPLRPSTTAAPAAGRRQLTVMFCDLVGSTELARRLDPEDLRDVMQAYQDCCGEVVAAHGGRIARYLGDGILVYFGYPQAHEDDAERAVRVGLGVVDAVARLATRSPSRLRVRVGIATGAVVVGDLIGVGATQEQAIVGETPNLAARLQSLAEPDTVVIAAGTHRLVGGLFDCIDLGQCTVKGYAEPIKAWRVIGESDVESRFAAQHRTGLTPLVGREHSLGLLLDRWARVQQREGHVVLLSGEPGIGKSRIIEAMRERLADQPCLHLRYFCSPHRQNSALHPFITQLERAAGIAPADPPEHRLDKLERLLGAWTRDVQTVARPFAALLAIPSATRYAPLNQTPQKLKESTLEAFVDLLTAIATQQSVLMIVEDAHWLDPTSLELLDLVVPRVKDLAVLLIITFRPEFAPPWLGHAHVGALPLGRLSRRQSADLVERVAGDQTLSDEVVGQIVGRAEGVPLFVEELTKAVLEFDELAAPKIRRGAPDHLPPIAIPSTLHDSLMARLDRLPSAKEIAQIGAVIGREFTYRVLAAVTRSPENELRSALDQLVAAELLFRRGTDPDTIFSFKHVLVQDAAYQSLLRSRRQDLHARTAIVLEEEFPEMAEAEPELIAHHCTRGGLPEKAVEFWHKAARRAAARSSHVEAIQHLKAALEVLATLPEGAERAQRELRTLVAMGVSLHDVKGPASAESVEVYERACALSDKAGGAVERFAALWGLWRSHTWRGDTAVADRLVKDLVGLAERESNRALLLQARHAQWSNAELSGNVAATLDCATSGLALYDPAACQSEIYRLSGHDPAVCGYGTLALASWLLGYPDRAAEKIGDALQLARRLAHPSSLANALTNALDLYLLRGEATPLRDVAEELIALASEQGFAEYLARGKFGRGWAIVLQDQGEEGAVLMRAALATVHGRHQSAFYRALTVEAHRRSGQAAEALRRVDGELADDVEVPPEYWLAAEVMRLIGESFASAAPDRHTAAERRFQMAIDISRRQGARSLELRAAMSLARLWRAQGRHAHAYDLLAPIFGWFTEGFDTPDLKDAKALLDALR